MIPVADQLRQLAEAHAKAAAYRKAAEMVEDAGRVDPTTPDPEQP